VFSGVELIELVLNADERLSDAPLERGARLACSGKGRRLAGGRCDADAMCEASF
jgi:hypothetical protein